MNKQIESNTGDQFENQLLSAFNQRGGMKVSAIKLEKIKKV